MKSYIWDLLLYAVFAVICVWSVAFHFGEVSRFWILIYSVIAELSFLVPYYLNNIEGELLTRIYSIASLIAVSALSYSIYEHHIDTKKAYPQTICGELINLTVDKHGTLLDGRHRLTRRYSYEVVSSTEPSVQFKSSSRTVDEDQKQLCVDYIDKRKSWLFSEHKVIHIRYDEYKC